MAEQNLGPRDFFAKEDAIADLGLCWNKCDFFIFNFFLYQTS